MATIFPTTVPDKTLAESIDGSASSFKISDILGWDGSALTSADFGTKAYAVLRDSNSTLMEIIEFDPSTIASTSITITLRGLKFTGDLTTEVAANKLTWGKGDTIISLGTSVPQLLMHYVDILSAQTIAGVKTFSSLPATSAGDPVANGDLARKAYVDAAVLGTLTTINVIVPGTAGDTIAAGDLIYLDTVTSNRWELCDADTPATVNNVLMAIAQGAGTDGNAITGGVMLRGVDTNQTGLTEGEVMYASNTAGGISNTPGTTEVTVGIAKATTELYFDPRFDQRITEDQQDALAGTSGTPSASNKYVTNDDTAIVDTASSIVRTKANGKIDTSFMKFGGDGSDGALALTSGATNIDLSNAAVVTLNYTSISITGTGSLTFTNPNTNGTIVVIKSQGAITLTSSTAPMIDASGLGAAGGAGGATDNNGVSGSPSTSVIDATDHFGVLGVAGGSGGGAGGAGGVIYGLPGTRMYTTTNLTYRKNIWVAAGSGAGGGGGGPTSAGITGGAGGNGGGGLIIECGGAWNFTTALGISVAGEAGTNGTDSNADSRGGAGGGGGGAAGMCVVLYETLTANTGTINSAGGVGGNGGAGPTGGVPSGSGGDGGGGAGAISGAGGAGGGADSSPGASGSAAGGAGAGGGGAGGGLNVSSSGGTGGAAGASSGGLVIENTEFA